MSVLGVLGGFGVAVGPGSLWSAARMMPPAPALGGRAHAKGLVFTTVVLGYERSYPLVEFRHPFIATDVDVIVFEGSPEAFHHHIVQGAATPVHADLDPMALKDPGEGLPGVLATLFGIEDPGFGSFAQCFLQALHAKGFVHIVAQFPGQDIPACPIHHDRQVDVAVDPTGCR